MTAAVPIGEREAGQRRARWGRLWYAAKNPIGCRVEFLNQRVPHKKIEIVQLWRCSSCKRVFTPTPSALWGKTYPLRIVHVAITLYDLGFSLEQTADKIRARHDP